MKSRILVLAMLLGVAGLSHAAATTVCDGAADASSQPVTAADGTDLFIKETFNMNCSKNTFVKYDQDTFAVGVCAASVKGKNRFGGSSEGGSVGNKGTCTGGVAAGDGCGTADATPVIATGCQ